MCKYKHFFAYKAAGKACFVCKKAYFVDVYSF